MRDLVELGVGAQVSVDGFLHLGWHGHHGDDGHAGDGGDVVDGGEVLRVGHGDGESPVDDGQRQQVVAAAQVIGHEFHHAVVDLVFVEVHEGEAQTLRQGQRLGAFGFLVHFLVAVFGHFRLGQRHVFGGVPWHGSGGRRCEHLWDVAGADVRRGVVFVFVFPSEIEQSSCGVTHAHDSSSPPRTPLWGLFVRGFGASVLAGAADCNVCKIIADFRSHCKG